MQRGLRPFNANSADSNHKQPSDQSAMTILRTMFMSYVSATGTGCNHKTMIIVLLSVLSGNERFERAKTALKVRVHDMAVATIS